jgi:Tfp pilus assembly protein PilO
MRTLTRHEKKLTLFLALAVAAGLHLLGLKVVLSFDQANRRVVSEKSAELEEAQGWMEQKAEWEEKSAWLEKNLKTVPTDNPAPALQKKSQSAATAAGLKIEEQTLQSPKPGVACTVVSNRMRLTGSLGQFVQWAAQLYQPEGGVALISLNLKLSPEPPKMVGEAEVGQFFRTAKE